jgi:nucleotide-binding universal stress UspA family protein
MLRKILVPYDGSKPADKAVEYAVALAKSIISDRERGCQIILLHVVPEIPTSPLFIERPMSTSDSGHIPLSRYIEKLYAEMQAHAAEMLETKKKELEAGSHELIVRTIVLIGDPIADKIVNHAGVEKADLIVIGNVGLSGVSKLKTLGSVSRAVSERAACPVMIVH